VNAGKRLEQMVSAENVANCQKKKEKRKKENPKKTHVQSNSSIEDSGKKNSYEGCLSFPMAKREKTRIDYGKKKDMGKMATFAVRDTP